MLNLREELERVLELSLENNTSWICINTAEPKYLIFQAADKYPKYVVQFGDEVQLSKVYEHLCNLYRIIPEVVPKPLSLCAATRDRSTVLVQTGMSGTPWFTLRNIIKSMEDWRSLKNRASDTLYILHSAITLEPDWSKTINLAAELRSTYCEYIRTSNITMPENLEKVVDTQIEILSDLPSIECHLQHGDFCLNNLLIPTRQQISVLDYEHFGRLHMPLHDEFSLTKSLIDFIPENKENEKAQAWETIFSKSRYRKILKEEHIPSLYLHSLLWWGIEASGNPQRSHTSDYIANQIEQYCCLTSISSKWTPVKFLDN